MQGKYVLRHIKNLKVILRRRSRDDAISTYHIWCINDKREIFICYESNTEQSTECSHLLETKGKENKKFLTKTLTLSNNHRTNVCMYLLHETLSHACPINEQLTGLRVRVVEPSKLGGRVICQYAAHPRFSTTKPIIAFAENLLTSLRWSLYSTDNNYISIIFTAMDHVEQGSPLTVFLFAADMPVRCL
ncbi:hypothetical protein V1478_014095 [Vespula squamosa]|uniref:Uncharacterized protein n=1 Tax=Vespula squamosa TaxID=30214 RepID=A0ABD2A725_VESSQ